MLALEHRFNREAGIYGFDLPEYFRTEELSPQGVVFDVSEEEINKLFSNFNCLSWGVDMLF